MKKLFFLFLLALNLIAFAQVPQGIPYQAAARGANGQPLVNTNVKVRFSIIDSVATGTTVYQETHTATTNTVGLFNVNVGLGTAAIGTFAGINWGKNFKFMKVELDPTGTGSNYTDLGTQQMMSVPYALYAGNVASNNSSAQSSNGINMQIFHAGISTWKVPTGVTSVLVEIWGAGGAGNNGGHCNACNCNIGGNSGSAGGYGKQSVNVVPDSIYTVDVGFGGQSLGANGGTSSFSNVYSTGGNGGTAVSSYSWYCNYFPVGGSSNAVINCTGGTGTSNAGPAGQVGCNNIGYGNGGGAGGNGGDGLIIIYW